MQESHDPVFFSNERRAEGDALLFKERMAGGN